MTKLTNDFSRYRQKMLARVMDFELQAHQKIVGLFTEFPALGDGHYAIAVIKERDKLYWQYRQWIMTKHEKWMGCEMFDLDAINIVQLHHTLTPTQKQQWQQHLQHLQQQKLPPTLHDDTKILLDGLHWQLKINTKILQFDYSWQLANQHFPTFQPLIDWINQPKTI